MNVLHRRDDGISLVEMLVAVTILGTILGIVAQGLIQAQTTMANNASRLDGLSRTNLSLEGMTRVLRTAILPSQIQASCTGCDEAAFISGDDFEVEFYANVNNDSIEPTSSTFGPRRVTYEVTETGSLVERIQTPNAHALDDFNFQYCDPDSPSCAVTERTLAWDVELTTPGGAVRPLFTFYDRTGRRIETPLQSDALDQVDSIDIVLSVKPSDRADSVTVTARVTLPNADSLIQPTPTP